MSNFIVDLSPQRSPGWVQARLGRLCASRAADMMSTIKSGGESAGRKKLRLDLVLERLTGQSQDSGYINDSMQRGIDLEPAAIAAYEARTGNLTRQTGFLAHPTLMLGCSPDGDIDDWTGLVECKAPNAATHYEYLRTGIVPPAYVPQLTHQLLVTGAAWVDFVSFDDRFPPALQLFIVRHPRDEAAIRSYELLCQMFLREVDEELQTVLDLEREAVYA